MAITISDIAKEAGVSTATVSRMMNASGYVSAKSKEKVEAAIKKLDYRPNAAAISLSKKESKVIGVMVPEISNNFFGEVIEGISQVADQAGYALMLFDTSESIEKELRALQMLRQQNLCGLILTPVVDVVSKNPDFYTCLDQLEVPVVLIDREVEGLDHSGVYCDNVKGAFNLTIHLQESGYESISVVAGDQNLKLGRDRLEGFMRAMRFNNKVVSSDQVLLGSFNKEATINVVSQSFDLENVPDAVLSCNNTMTEGLIEALHAKGLLDKVAIASFDPVPWAKYLNTNIIQLERNTRYMGERATRMLFDEMKDTQMKVRSKVIVETKIL